MRWKYQTSLPRYKICWFDYFWIQTFPTLYSSMNVALMVQVWTRYFRICWHCVFLSPTLLYRRYACAGSGMWWLLKGVILGFWVVIGFIFVCRRRQRSRYFYSFTCRCGCQCADFSLSPCLDADISAIAKTSSISLVHTYSKTPHSLRL